VTKTLIFTIVDHGVSAVADLLEKRAPVTCDLIWNRLPLEGRLVHGMYSGPELFILLDGFPAVPAENQVARPIPGDIGYWHLEAGLHVSEPDELAELVYVYDRGAAIKGPEGQDSSVNLFARLRPEGDAEFLALSKRFRREGPWTLRIERGVAE
jgi:hypothetical protein